MIQQRLHLIVRQEWNMNRQEQKFHPITDQSYACRGVFGYSVAAWHRFHVWDTFNTLPQLNIPPVCASPPTCAPCAKIPHRRAKWIPRSRKYQTIGALHVLVAAPPWKYGPGGVANLRDWCTCHLPRVLSLAFLIYGTRDISILPCLAHVVLFIIQRWVPDVFHVGYSPMRHDCSR